VQVQYAGTTRECRWHGWDRQHGYGQEPGYSRTDGQATWLFQKLRTDDLWTSVDLCWEWTIECIGPILPVFTHM
jgi:hypothetical protein